MLACRPRSRITRHRARCGRCGRLGSRIRWCMPGCRRGRRTGSRRSRGRGSWPRCRLGRRSRCHCGQGSLVLSDDPLDGRDENVFCLVVLLLVRVRARHCAPVSKSQHAIHSRQDQPLRIQLPHLGFQRLAHVVLEVSEGLHQPRVEGLVGTQILPARLEHPEHDLLQALLFWNRALGRQPKAAVDDGHGNSFRRGCPLRQLFRDRRLEIGDMPDQFWRNSWLEDQRAAVCRGLRWPCSDRRCCLRR